MSGGDAVVQGCAPMGPRYFPNAEEMRMVRAVALLAVLEAVRHGEYRATFHGFRVEAVRHPRLDHVAPSVEVNMVVTLAGTVIESGALEVEQMQTSSPATACLRSRVVDGETSIERAGH